MITTEILGELNLKSLYGSGIIEDTASAAAAKVSNEFAHYIRENRYDNYFEKNTGKTLDSIGVYRKSGKKPVYVIRAGLGIRGSLNYLAGLYAGQAVSRSGKKFSYYKPRNLIVPGWRDFQGDNRLHTAFDEILKKRIEA